MDVDIREHGWTSPFGTIPDDEVEAMAKELFPYWSGGYRSQLKSYDDLAKKREVHFKERTGVETPGAGLLEAAFMVCCLSRLRRSEDTKARVAWEKRSDDFWNPMSGAGWAKR